MNGDRTKRMAMALAALGVVFGDIGTSPLYAFEAAVAALGETSERGVIGVASLIVWSVLLVVSGKYLLVVLRADYRGEGGVFALLALLRGKRGGLRGGTLPFWALALLLGAAMLIGDGTITPAISVLSAMEGLEAVHANFRPVVLPATVAILIALFSVQRFGTGQLGKVFGWTMLVWFLVIGGLGAWWIWKVPKVLAALNPGLAVELLVASGGRGFFVLGAVVLVVTGVEALYADLGHFNRRTIAMAWYGVVLPGLLLNYLGQAALVVTDPGALGRGTPFFELAPGGWATLALVGLATVATVVASQALISGVFSLTAQAQEMGFAPRVNVVHTSRDERGQVYVPVVNLLLGLLCILLVLTFRRSENLAAAYGLAVVSTMVITTGAIGLVARDCWGWPWWRVGVMVGIFLTVEIPFLVAGLMKLPDGAYFPLLVGGAFLVVMLTWWKGRWIIIEVMRGRTIPVNRLAERMETMATTPGQLVFITTNKSPGFAVARVLEMLRRGGGMREQIVILSLVSAMEGDVDIGGSVEVRKISQRLWHVVAGHGFMQEPHAPEILALARERSAGGIAEESGETFYVLPRELIVEYTGGRMRRWQRALFGVLSRNVSFAPDYFYIPTDRIVVFTWMVRA